MSLTPPGKCKFKKIAYLLYLVYHFLQTSIMKQLQMLLLSLYRIRDSLLRPDPDFRCSIIRLNNYLTNYTIIYSERLFSTAGNVFEEKRSSLLPENGERLIFIKKIFLY